MATINGDNNDNLIIGTDSADTLTGEGGADLINGMDGSDEMDGGDGDDLMIDAPFEIIGTGLLPGARLDIGQGIISSALNAAFVMQDDGNVEILMDLDGDGTFRFENAFGSDVSGLGGVALEFRADGTIDIVDGDDNVLDTYGSASGGAVEFVVENTGEAIYYNGPSSTTFESGTDLIVNNHGIGLNFDSDNDDMVGGEGDDAMLAGDGKDSLEGGDGNDTMHGGDGNDTLKGGDGDDVMMGGVVYDVPDLRSDRDKMYGGDGNDTMFGDNGNDVLQGDDGDDLMDGGDGKDYMAGGFGADTMNGGADNDTMNGGHGDDEMTDDLGRDNMIGGAGNDTMTSGLEADRVNAGSGDDEIDGGDGADRLIGGAGNDTIDGGEGRDRANFSGSIHDHSWVINGDGTVTVTDNVGAGGVDELESIEMLRFRDYTFDLERQNEALIEADDQRVGEDDTVTFTVTTYDYDGTIASLNAIASDGGTITSVSETNIAGDGMSTDAWEIELMYDPGAIHQGLREGDIAREEIEIQVVDNNGNVAVHTIDLIIDGATDVAFVEEPTATATASEDDVTVVTGELELLAGVDDGDVTYAVEGTGVGDYGTMTIDADGVWTYTLDNASEDVQDLLGAEEVMDDFVFTVTDGLDTDRVEMEVTVVGADEPVAPGTETFESLELTGGSNTSLEMPDGFAGLDWSAAARAISTPTYKAGSYERASTSGDIAVLIQSSDGFDFQADDMDDTFDLEQMFMTSVSRFTMDITATAFLDGVEVGSQTFGITKAEATLVEFDGAIFDGVDRVEFTSSFSSGAQFLIDDLLIS